MYKIKSLALVAVTILFVGLFVSGAAQNRLPPQPIQPSALSGTYKAEVKANELSPGDIEFTTGATYGWTSYGTTEGELSGYMFISMNYSSPQAPPLDAEMFDVISGGVSEVTGGSWSKLIFINGQYAGSVHGRIVGGQLAWNGNNLTATMSLQLTSDEGTVAYVGSKGSGTFEGILDQNAKASSVSGTLVLNY